MNFLKIKEHFLYLRIAVKIYEQVLNLTTCFVNTNISVNRKINLKTRTFLI